MSKSPILTQERLREVLHYDPSTGIFTWLKRISIRIVVGARAGTSSGEQEGGRRQIGVDGVHYREHRLAWLYMTGEWPHPEVDHKNMDASDNRWENLREATPVQNQGNKHAYANSRSGVKGVYWHTAAKRWAAVIRMNRKSQHLGLFDDIEGASAAYAAAASDYFGQFARVS